MAWTSSSYGPGVGAAEAHMQQLYAAGEPAAQAFAAPVGGESFAHARGGGRQSKTAHAQQLIRALKVGEDDLAD